MSQQTPAEIIIAFALYPGVTQLDFTGPHQVLSRVPRAVLKLASSTGGTIRADDGIDFSTVRLRDIQGCNVLCVPGGGGCAEAILDTDYMDAVRRLASGADFVTSVCTGSLILGAAGFLRGRRATSHWAWRDHLAAFGATVEPGRVVRDGNVITGGGVTAGIDFALTLAAELGGERLAKAIQLSLEYAPAPPFNCGRPEEADAETMALVSRSTAKARFDRETALRQAVEAFRRVPADGSY